jgi:hypothetical protein
LALLKPKKAISGSFFIKKMNFEKGNIEIFLKTGCFRADFSRRRATGNSFITSEKIIFKNAIFER